MDLNIDITYKQAWRSKKVALESLFGCHVASFAQLPYYCHNLEMINDGTVTHIETDNEDRFKMVFIALGVVIQSFKKHMRPLIIIDAAHLKGTYQGTNLLAVGMDGNNQIIPIVTGVSQGHLLMNCKLKSIRLQFLFWKMWKAYSPEDFNMAINELGTKRPDVYQKLTEAGVEKWSRAYCPSDRYNYMTSNLAESINSLTRDVRKIPITNLMEWYRDLVQRWYCEHAPLNELSDWATAKITKRRQKSVNWIVGAIDRVTGLTDFNHLAKGWFRRKALEGTYQELVYPVGEVSSWQRPNYLQVVKPPLMDKKPAGRPKSTARIRSQGKEPVPVRCGRCGAHGHNRNSCRETIPQKKAMTGYSQQEHYYSEQEHYYSQQAMPFSFKAVDLNDP
ncbi:hypothetical protein Tco_1154200 [Tanacetum coccineum]